MRPARKYIHQRRLWWLYNGNKDHQKSNQFRETSCGPLIVRKYMLWSFPFPPHCWADIDINPEVEKQFGPQNRIKLSFSMVKSQTKHSVACWFPGESIRYFGSYHPWPIFWYMHALCRYLRCAPFDRKIYYINSIHREFLFNLSNVLVRNVTKHSSTVVLSPMRRQSVIASLVILFDNVLAPKQLMISLLSASICPSSR